VFWLVLGLIGLVLAIIAAMIAYLGALKLLRAVPVADADVIVGLMGRLPRRLAGPLSGLVRQLSTR
jgi:hypothetical protein